MFLSCSKFDSRIPESALGRGPSASDPEMAFSDTALAAFQRIAQPLFDPFQPVSMHLYNAVFSLVINFRAHISTKINNYRPWRGK